MILFSAEKYIHFKDCYWQSFIFIKKASISEKSGLVLFLCPKGGDNMKKDTCEKSIVQERGHYIFRASRKNPKTGQIEYAKNYGKKAFKIWVND